MVVLVVPLIFRNLVPLENQEINLLTNKSPEPEAWVNKYLTAPSMLREENDNKRGRNPSIFTSNPNQTPNQLVEDRVIKVPNTIKTANKNVAG